MRFQLIAEQPHGQCVVLLDVIFSVVCVVLLLLCCVEIGFLFELIVSVVSPVALTFA